MAAKKEEVVVDNSKQEALDILKRALTEEEYAIVVKYLK